jgi:hypothetical protein
MLMEPVTMTKNGKVLNSREARLEYITIELFNSIRGCYNKGNNELQATIQDQCMDIILESLENGSNKQLFKNMFDSLTVDRDE